MADREPHPSRPRLSRELVLNLGLLGVAALALAVTTSLAVPALPPRLAPLGFAVLILADLAIVIAFGRYLVVRLVLHPVAGLTAAADAIAAGDLAARAPAAETAEFSRLAERINEMTEALLDVQSQLVRAEKLASIGRLAAGVAHEVGNPLAAIGTYLEVLKRRGVDPEVLRDLARETERIDRIVRSLLAYARPAESAGGVVDPANAIGVVIELLERQGRIRQPPFQLDLHAPLPLVRGPADQFEQVLVNLILNALDADPSGAVTVAATGSAFSGRSSEAIRRGDDPTAPPPARRHRAGRRPSRTDLAAGAEGLLLVVADHGPGVPLDDRERIFDPFFTTKAPGAGSGLGLAIVQRTVTELGGVVWVDDAREGGAAFKVFLPEYAPEVPR